MRADNFIAWMFISFWGLVFLGFVGWCNNINYLLDSDFGDISGREVVSALGVVIAPIGAVNGVVYIFEDEKSE